MQPLEFARVIETMTDSQFDAFIASLPSAITEEDKKTMILHRSLYKMLSGQKAKREAMCKALGEQLYEEFNA